MLEDVIIVWFLTMGVFALTKEQMPFEFWQKIAFDKNLEMRSILFEPLTECLCCMASFWTCFWFGWNYQLNTLFLSVILAFLCLVVLFSCVLKRAVDVDLFSKILYFSMVFFFVWMLPEKHFECAFCMVAVVGINYHLVRIIGRCKE